MRTIKTILLVVLPAWLLVSCGGSDEFVIEGSFTRTDPTPVSLYMLQEEGTLLVDSVASDGKSFRLTGTTETANIFLVRFFNDQQVYLVIRPGDRIGLDIDNSMSRISYYVANSPDSKYIRELFDEQDKVLRKIDQLSREFELSRADSTARRRIDSTYYDLMEQHQEFTRGFIHAHPQSLANIMALYQNFGKKSRPLFDKYDDLDIFNFVDSNLTAVYPNSYPVIALNKDLTEINEQIAHRKMIEKKVEIGYPLPEGILPLINGDTIDLAMPSKSYTLLLFWASWNSYSTRELKGLQDFLDREPRISKELRIVTVSLDSSEERLQEWMTRHDITLPVVCDYEYWDSEPVARFAVRQIPGVIVADKQGKVIIRDVFAGELYSLLKESIY